MSESPTRHATAVAFGGRGVLILGRSGAGKSALGLTLIGMGAALVADDRVHLSQRDGAVWASAPERLTGLIEARGLGLLRLAHQAEVELVLAADLDREVRSRLPTPCVMQITDVALPLIEAANRPNVAYEIMAILRYGLSPPLKDPDPQTR